MKLYKLFLIGIMPIMLYAQSLKEIIDASLQNNYNIKSLQIQSLSKQKLFQSTKNIYSPSLVVGASHSKLDIDKKNTQIGSSTSLFLKFSLSLYDGGKNEALKKQKYHELNMAKLGYISAKKELMLEIITMFYQAKIIEEKIKALEEKSATLKAEYNRVKAKYDTQMTSYDNVLKLQSEYESNNYAIKELKYQQNLLLQNLSLISNTKITSLDNSKLKEFKDIKFKESENIKAVEENIKALDENIKIISSSKKPKLQLENTLSRYSYDDYDDKILKDLPQEQNQLLITLTYNLFDTSSKDKKQSAILLKKAKITQLQYLKAKEKTDFILSKQKLLVQKLKINSAKSALKSAKSVFEIIKTKYQNGVVDSIAYLDALSKKTNAQATYKQALYEYEIAKALYYITSGEKFDKLFDDI